MSECWALAGRCSLERSEKPRASGVTVWLDAPGTCQSHVPKCFRPIFPSPQLLVCHPSLSWESLRGRSWGQNHLLGYLLLLAHSLLWHHKKPLWEVIEISSYKALQQTAVCLDAAEKRLLNREHQTSTLDLINWNLLISWTLTLGDFLFVGWIFCSVVLFSTYTQYFLLRHGFLLMCSFCLIVQFKIFCHVLLWFNFSYFKPYLCKIRNPL